MKAKTRSTKPSATQSATGRARPVPAPGPMAAAEDTPAGPSADERLSMIALAAYYRAEQRGFAPGAALEDWLAAEAEIDRRLGEPTLVEHQLAHSDT